MNAPVSGSSTITLTGADANIAEPSHVPRETMNTLGEYPSATRLRFLARTVPDRCVLGQIRRTRGTVLDLLRVMLAGTAGNRRYA